MLPKFILNKKILILVCLAYYNYIGQFKDAEQNKDVIKIRHAYLLVLSPCFESIKTLNKKKKEFQRSMFCCHVNYHKTLSPIPVNTFLYRLFYLLETVWQLWHKTNLKSKVWRGDVPVNSLLTNNLHTQMNTDFKICFVKQS